VSLEEAQHSARLATLAMLASLKRVLGDLDRVNAWLVVNGYVNGQSEFAQTAAVLNPCSSLLLELYGQEGVHARTAIGIAALPLDLPVVISAEVETTPD
jgi:enamine deaminase RidA (YjgF/YER057c/UK114 family)